MEAQRSRGELRESGAVRERVSRARSRTGGFGVSCSFGAFYLGARKHADESVWQVDLFRLLHCQIWRQKWGWPITKGCPKGTFHPPNQPCKGVLMLAARGMQVWRSDFGISTEPNTLQAFIQKWSLDVSTAPWLRGFVVRGACGRPSSVIHADEDSLYPPSSNSRWDLKTMQPSTELLIVCSGDLSHRKSTTIVMH